jgi:pimeloyl-ACP methyl ester carboxylesterase
MTGVPVHHLRTTVAGVDIFYREAGQADAPAVLLPHGYPCSSFEFRNYMARLGDRWRLLAPDFPGSGYSATPPGFAYDFDGFAELLAAFLDGLGIARLRELVTGDHFRDEFLNHVRSDLAERIPPDLWTLHWSLMTDRRRENAARIIYDLRDNLAWFPRYQAWLREHEPPALILWGPQDGYMPEEAGRAWLRDLPEAELHMLDGGHWLLETCLEEAVALTKDFLGRKHPPD